MHKKHRYDACSYPIMAVNMVDTHDEEYKQEVMLTCKILLDSLREGKRMELADVLTSNKKKIQFIANIIKLGDTFRSDNTQPVYGLLFTTESDDYLMRKAGEIGLAEKSRVQITIQPIGEKVDEDNER